MQQHFLYCFVDLTAKRSSDAQFSLSLLIFARRWWTFCGVLCYGAQVERFESVSYTKVGHGPTRTMMEWKQHVGNSTIGSIFFISPARKFPLSSLCSTLATAPANDCSSQSESAFGA